MILWILLFVLVMAISFVLALKSMKDYREIPEKSGQSYGLFLIRKSESLTKELLVIIHDNFLKKEGIISFERLIKGDKSALVVFGPKNILVNFKDMLSLLELEDYTGVNIKDASAWEVGVKDGHYFKNFPSLSGDEQFWWQLVLSAKKGKSAPDKLFQGQIRAVVICGDHSRRTYLTQILQNLSPGRFVKLPQAFSTEQIIDFYQKRSLKPDEKNTALGIGQVMELLLF